jgi:MerR family transcriptional regulator, light-induced transcriptional regulator
MSSLPGPSIGATRPWQEQAVSTVVDALYARHPGLAQRFAQGGLDTCSEYIHQHLDYLDAALATGEPALFTDYAIWVKLVLNSRGVPSSHLAESFDLLAAFLATHMPTADADRVRLVLTAACAALQRDDLPSPYVHDRLSALPETAQYVQAALRGGHRAAEELMAGAMQAGYSLTEASVRLVQPAMYEVGRLWQENRITVAQEHLASAISQNVLARSYLRATFAPSAGRRALFACAAGNRHSLGLRMLADAFDTIGWDAAYLGADVPLSDLVRHVDASPPDLLGLSISLPGQLALTHETIQRLRAEFGGRGTRGPTIWVGGLATLSGERIWRSLQADGWAADALHALEQIAP